MYEIETIIILAFSFIAAYLVGVWRNNRLILYYARSVSNFLQPYSASTKFSRHGQSGFRCRAELRENSPYFKEIEVAVTLVDRENLMHYPLALITKDYDRITVWASLRGSINSSSESENLDSSRRVQDLRPVVKTRSPALLKAILRLDYEEEHSRVLLKGRLNKGQETAYMELVFTIGENLIRKEVRRL